jgi:uncharacterized tellurite resistance protein B-like protein
LDKVVCYEVDDKRCRHASEVAVRARDLVIIVIVIAGEAPTKAHELHRQREVLRDDFQLRGVQLREVHLKSENYYDGIHLMFINKI